jgi:hypothetical protein
MSKILIDKEVLEQWINITFINSLIEDGEAKEIDGDYLLVAYKPTSFDYENRYSHESQFDIYNQYNAEMLYNKLSELLLEDKKRYVRDASYDLFIFKDNELLYNECYFCCDEDNPLREIFAKAELRVNDLLEMEAEAKAAKEILEKEYAAKLTDAKDRKLYEDLKKKFEGGV